MTLDQAFQHLSNFCWGKTEASSEIKTLAFEYRQLKTTLMMWFELVSATCNSSEQRSYTNDMYVEGWTMGVVVFDVLALF